MRQLRTSCVLGSSRNSPCHPHTPHVHTPIQCPPHTPHTPPTPPSHLHTPSCSNHAPPPTQAQQLKTARAETRAAALEEQMRELASRTSKEMASLRQQLIEREAEVAAMAAEAQVQMQMQMQGLSVMMVHGGSVSEISSNGGAKQRCTQPPHTYHYPHPHPSYHPHTHPHPHHHTPTPTESPARPNLGPSPTQQRTAPLHARRRRDARQPLTAPVAHLPSTAVATPQPQPIPAANQPSLAAHAPNQPHVIPATHVHAHATPTSAPTTTRISKGW